MTRKVCFAATQMACSWNTEANLNRAEALVRQAVSAGADVVLLQELFETPYFPKDEDARHFELAQSVEGHPTLARFAGLAAELNVLLPISFFERANNANYNSLAVIDADGTMLGIYRKSHIPQAPGYEEKFYFSPGDTGFKVWDTTYGRFGFGICWDQWFPEAARIMTLMGAETLFYPTAIGSEPGDDTLDSKDHWQRVMQGHAAANMVPVIASNRIGVEDGDSCTVTFYGSSFIADHTGELRGFANRDEQEIVTATFDLDEIAAARMAWGIFRDRRPELYGVVNRLDGKQ